MSELPSDALKAGRDEMSEWEQRGLDEEDEDDDEDGQEEDEEEDGAAEDDDLELARFACSRM